MKYLKHFATQQQAEQILSSWPVDTISSIENITGVKFTKSSVQQLPPNNEIWYKTHLNSKMDFYLTGFKGTYPDTEMLDEDRERMGFVSQEFDGEKWIVHFNKDVTTIYDSMFGKDTNRAYSQLYEVILPKSVKIIEARAFNCCPITNIILPEGLLEIGLLAFGGCGVYYSGSSDSPTDGASIKIPNSVTTIEKNAFQSVFHIEYYGTATGAPWGALSMN